MLLLLARRLLPICLLACGLTVLPAGGPASGRPVVHRVTPARADTVSLAVPHERVVRLQRPASQVTAYWRGMAHAQVSVALSSDGSHYGPSQPVGRDEMGLERADGTTYGALVAADGAVAVRVTTDRPIASLHLLGLSDGASTTTSRVAGAPVGSASASTSEPTVVPRAGWGADPTYMTDPPTFHPVRKLIVHHTDTSDSYTDRAGAEEQIRAIYYYHSVTQGWGDIGYNFLVDKFGTVYEGRYSRDYAGADPTGDNAAGEGTTGMHTQGWNSGTVGIALLGTLTDHDATAAQREALERLLAWEADRNGIDPLASERFTNPVSGASLTTPNIAGHRDYKSTACPGDAFYATLPQLRRDVAALLGASDATDSTPPTAPIALSAAAGRTSVTLSWMAAGDDVAVRGYEVWRRRRSAARLRLSGTGTTRFTSTGLRRHTRYVFEVRAVDTAGNRGPFSRALDVRTR